VTKARQDAAKTQQLAGHSALISRPNKSNGAALPPKT
jgi:hypothetical protein